MTWRAVKKKSSSLALLQTYRSVAFTTACPRMQWVFSVNMHHVHICRGCFIKFIKFTHIPTAYYFYVLLGKPLLFSVGRVQSRTCGVGSEVVNSSVNSVARLGVSGEHKYNNVEKLVQKTILNEKHSSHGRHSSSVSVADRNHQRWTRWTVWGTVSPAPWQNTH